MAHLICTVCDICQDPQSERKHKIHDKTKIQWHHEGQETKTSQTGLKVATAVTRGVGEMTKGAGKARAAYKAAKRARGPSGSKKGPSKTAAVLDVAGSVLSTVGDTMEALKTDDSDHEQLCSKCKKPLHFPGCIASCYECSEQCEDNDWKKAKNRACYTICDSCFGKLIS
eukprot:m.1235 g.1235  ORF g.1235 m.1235 type:complete len:170 (+) comp5917_c0_seq1:233-742(+)